MSEEYQGRRVSAAPVNRTPEQGGRRALPVQEPEADDPFFDDEETEETFEEEEPEEVPEEEPEAGGDGNEDSEPAPKSVKKKRKQTAKKSAKKKKRKKNRLLPTAAVIAVLLVLLIAVRSCGKTESSDTVETGDVDSVGTDLSASAEGEDEAIQIGGIAVSTEYFSSQGEVHTVQKTSDIPSDYIFEPHCTDETDPSNFIAYTNVMQNGTILDDVSDYDAGQEITFGEGVDYTDVQGIVSFRGNNFRDDPTYGFAELEEYAFEELWSHPIGSLDCGTHVWSGTGWTGQPLIVKWPDETKQIMNLYDWAKESDDMVEVIQATMDGTIYFYDLYTGEATRDSISIGLPFKGAGALDPRGYPILYVGSGYDSSINSHAMIISLIDGSILYNFGGYDTFALRQVYYYDSSALVDAETDTLIYPGEDGVLYLLHLNTDYDEAAGTLSVDPEVTEWRYYSLRTQNTGNAQYWLGMEDSAVTYDGYLFIADNGGNLMCLDLNTLKLVWVQDTLDDTNGSPVMSFEDGHPYLYIGCSLHNGWRSTDSGTVNFWKIDAENGEVVWTDEFNVFTQDDVSGGIQSTAALGKYGLDGYVYVTVSKTANDLVSGSLYCLDCETGKTVWQHDSTYAWSSPVCVYNSDGSGTVIYANSGGELNMLDGLTGEVHETLDISEHVIEASPAIYEDVMVIGLREGYVRAYQLN